MRILTLHCAIIKNRNNLNWYFIENKLLSSLSLRMINEMIKIFLRNSVIQIEFVIVIVVL